MLLVGCVISTRLIKFGFFARVPVVCTRLQARAAPTSDTQSVMQIILFTGLGAAVNIPNANFLKYVGVDETGQWGAVDLVSGAYLICTDRIRFGC